MATVDARFTVNGKEHALTTDPDRSVLEVLREDLQLTGTKYGCGEGACGACTILIDNKPKFSCSLLVKEIAGRKITTIEGLATGDTLQPAQQAFLENEAFQCGYCTAGMIVATAALLESSRQPSDEQITRALNTHICRCCTYPKIASAVRRAAEIAGSKA
jgi:aerobic-type carbon monoxide dehydrogenase small subunit (CoxS/CutS family)